MPKLTPDDFNQKPTEEYLMLNAIDCWLYHFPDHKWTPLYKQLREKALEANAAVLKDEVPKRPRPAKRARKAKASSTTQGKDTGENATEKTS